MVLVVASDFVELECLMVYLFGSTSILLVIFMSFFSYLVIFQYSVPDVNEFYCVTLGAMVIVNFWVGVLIFLFLGK